jgi:hypothetical protein
MPDGNGSDFNDAMKGMDLAMPTVTVLAFPPIFGSHTAKFLV